MPLFKLEANCTFEAENIDGALVFLAKHLIDVIAGIDPADFKTGSFEVFRVQTKLDKYTASLAMKDTVEVDINNG